MCVGEKGLLERGLVIKHVREVSDVGPSAVAKTLSHQTHDANLSCATKVSAWFYFRIRISNLIGKDQELRI